MSQPDRAVEKTARSKHLVMALVYVEAETPDEATAVIAIAVGPHKTGKGVVLSFTPEAQGDPHFWRDLEAFNVNPGDVRDA